MSMPIEQLEEELWWKCVQEHAAKDQEMAERWQTDESAHLREGYTILPMPDSLQPLVEKAIAQWRERKKKICSRLQMPPEQFVAEFTKARDQFLRDDDQWSVFVTRVGHVVYGAVRNMNWVNLFGWILPVADADNEDQHRETGRFIAALFYTELLLKYGNQQGNERDSVMRRIEVRWQLANG